MSVALLSSYDKVPALQNDLESFFHVLLYMAARFLSHNRWDKQDVSYFMNQYFGTVIDYYDRYVVGSAKYQAIMWGSITSDYSRFCIHSDCATSHPLNEVITHLLPWFKALYTIHDDETSESEEEDTSEWESESEEEGALELSKSKAAVASKQSESEEEDAPEPSESKEEDAPKPSESKEEDAPEPPESKEKVAPSESKEEVALEPSESEKEDAPEPSQPKEEVASKHELPEDLRECLKEDAEEPKSQTSLKQEGEQSGQEQSDSKRPADKLNSHAAIVRLIHDSLQNKSLWPTRDKVGDQVLPKYQPWAKRK